MQVGRRGSRRVRLGAHAIILAGHLLDAPVRNIEIRLLTFVRPIPAKMPANRTASVNFYRCFQCAAEIFS
jgi:hypothetical protein